MICLFGEFVNLFFSNRDEPRAKWSITWIQRMKDDRNSAYSGDRNEHLSTYTYPRWIREARESRSWRESFINRGGKIHERASRCVRVPSIGNRTISIDTVLDETGRDRKVVNALVTNVERDNRIGYGPLKRLRHLTNALQTAIWRRYVTFRLRLATFEMDFPVNQTSVMPTANPINPPPDVREKRRGERSRRVPSFQDPRDLSIVLDCTFTIDHYFWLITTENGGLNFGDLDRGIHRGEGRFRLILKRNLWLPKVARKRKLYVLHLVLLYFYFEYFNFNNIVSSEWN